jgi:uncharacterized protein (TIRG00374 family)
MAADTALWRGNVAQQRMNGLSEVRASRAADVDVSQSRSRMRAGAGVLVRIVASGALLWFLLRNVAVIDVVRLLGESTKRWPYLVLAAVSPVVGILIGALRWRVLLRAQGVPLAVAQLMKANLVGMFYNQFLPSTIGGDVARSYWVSGLIASAHGESSPSSSAVVNLTVVGVDRLVGVFGILTAGMLAAIASPSTVRQVPGIWAVFLAGMIAVGMLVLLLRIPPRAAARRVLGIGVLARLRSKAVMIFRALDAYRAQPKPLLVAFSLSLVLQCNVILQYWFLAVALGITLSILQLAVLVPIVDLISMIPITINGIGLRENALNALGGPLGVTVADAVSLAWAFLVIRISYALVGGVVQFGKGPWRALSTRTVRSQ